MDVSIKKVAFDARMVHNSGIGTYIRGLNEAIIHGHPPGSRPDFLYLGDPRLLTDYEYFRSGGEIVPALMPIYSLREQLFFPQPAGAAFFHFPHYNVPRRLARPYMVTIHDLVHQKFPEVLDSRVKWAVSRAMLRHAARHALVIITASGSSRRDIADYCGVTESSIRIIYHAVAPSFRQVSLEDAESFRQDMRLPKRYLLAVGINKPHKNFPFLIEAFIDWTRRNGGGIDLVISGMNESDRQLLGRFIMERGCADRVHLIPYVTCGKLSALYQAAEALVYPSLCEGFGIPIIEAQRVGTPVISSNTSSMPEVAGDGALYFNPRSKTEFHARLDEFFGDESARSGLVRRGYENEKRFCWGTAAALTLREYQRFL